jgi:cysteinyl-tRNA synthetase
LANSDLEQFIVESLEAEDEEFMTAKGDSDESEESEDSEDSEEKEQEEKEKQKVNDQIEDLQAMIEDMQK